jgi:hypothetical protein
MLTATLQVISISMVSSFTILKVWQAS